MLSITWKFVLVSVAVILAFHGIAIGMGWYWTHSWIDIPMHLIGGAWVACLFVLLFRDLFTDDILANVWERFKILIIMVSFTALVGVLWEFHEYIFSEFLKIYLQSSLNDTLKDLFMDIVGGAIASALILFFPRRSLRAIKEN